MTAFHFANPVGLVAVLAIPLLWLAFRWGDRGRAAALAAWGGSPYLPASPARRALLYAAALGLALALARPSWQPPAPPAPPRPGDIVFLLDVSRSMLATDAAPSRLARAKALARSLTAEAQGRRLALVAFAGSQAIECPLTLDHAFLLDALDAASRDSVVRGGTAVAAAIRFALNQVFDDVSGGGRTIVLLTDGGDRDPEAPGAARAAAARGVALVALGVGDEQQGALVPRSESDPSPFLYLGHPVRTRLDAAILRALAGPAFLPDHGGIDPAQVFQRWLAPHGAPPRDAESDDNGWLICLAAAAFLLALEPRLPDYRKRAAAALVLLLLVRPPAGFAQSIEEWFGKGMEALKDNQPQEAIHYFGDASRWAPDVPEIRFNLGKSLYEFQAYFEAALAFEQAARGSRDSRFQAKCRLGQGNALFRDAELLAAAQPGQAIERLEQCVAAYREALRLDPGVFHAAYNLEVAQHRLEQVRARSLTRPPGEPPPLPQITAQEVLDQAPHAAPPANKRAAGPAVERDW